jgi:hypothetical protein
MRVLLAEIGGSLDDCTQHHSQLQTRNVLHAQGFGVPACSFDRGSSLTVCEHE